MFVDHRYPATTTELIAAYGDSEIQLQNGTETMATFLVDWARRRSTIRRLSETH